VTLAAEQNTQTPTAEELVQRAEALVPMLRERADETESLRRVPEATMAVLHEQGLLKYYQPKCYGGYELDWGTHFKIGRAIAKGCSSTAWIVAVVGGHTCYVGRFPKEAQDEVWADGPDVLISTGSVQKSGTVKKVPGGFQLSGAWGFASGVDHAQWGMVAGRMEGEKEVSQYLFPRKDFTIDDVWHVAGMKGTGTKDIVLNDAFVPEHRVLKMSRFTGAMPPGGEANEHYIYRTEFRPFSGSSLLGPILGTAEGAFADYTAMTRERTGAIFGDKVADNPAVQLRVSESGAELAAAAALAERMYDTLNGRGKKLEPFTEEERATLMRDRAYVMKLCRQSCERLVTMMGAQGLFNTNPVQRAFRDLHAMATQFGVNWDLNMPPYGRLALGLPSGAR
jgi:3-hydroxy-9,10-secoandrosta-1,3,5(10)-triene-9,17-dione monooxygenase